MSIRIVSKEELGQAQKNEKGIGFIPAVLFPNLKNLYQRRAERFDELAKDDPFAAYLEFAAEITRAQQKALYDNPLEMDMDALMAANMPGKALLDCRTFQRTEHDVSLNRFQPIDHTRQSTLFDGIFNVFATLFVNNARNCTELHLLPYL